MGALHPLADPGASPRPKAASKEVDCHLRLLAEAGAVNRRHAEIALRLFDEVRAITWRLLHPRNG